MNRPYDVVTFDCYGTLIDWETGIGDWFEREAAKEGREISRKEALALYAATEPRIEAGPYRSYRRVLTETALEVGKAFGLDFEEQSAKTLADSLPEWPPFPDTIAALERLKGVGYDLAVLSNVDEDLLAGTMRALGVPIAWTITAEKVRSYKPASAHFLAARESIGSGRWLHAAQSFFHDIAPASALGIETAWVNRKGERAPSAVPGLEVRTLGELTESLGTPT